MRTQPEKGKKPSVIVQSEQDMDANLLRRVCANHETRATEGQCVPIKKLKPKIHTLPLRSKMKWGGLAPVGLCVDVSSMGC